MRILHVISNLDPANGGPQVICLSLAAGQVGLGHDVTVVAEPSAAGTKWVTGLREKMPGLGKVRIEDLDRQGGNLAVLLGRGKSSALERLISATDFVHLHSVWDPAVKIASDIARRQRKPYAVLLNGMLDPWSLSQSRAKKKIALALGYRGMLRGASFLHLGNADERDLIAPLGLGVRGEIVPNGVFLEELSPRPEAGRFRARYPAIGDRPVVLFLSRLHYKKGLDYLAGAFEVVAREVPEAMLVVAGPDGGAEGDFRSRIEAAGLSGRVVMTGPVYGREKLEALVDATVFCLPSRQEGFSMAITEALGIGTPVVISENCHFPEVAPAGAGAVVPLEVGRIGAALVRVLRDPALREAQASAAAELIRGQYTWPRIAERCVALYQGVTSL